MSINALDRYAPSERAGILAELALATSPHPRGGADVEAITKRYGDLLHEIARKAGVVGDPLSVTHKKKFNEYISTALTGEVLRSKDINQVLGRAGEAGRLPPSLYSIDIRDGFRKNFARFRVSDLEVKTCVSRCDDVQHLESGDDNSSSLFMRYVEPNKGSPYWEIAQFHRVGRVLSAHCFWRIYPSEINISDANTPVEVLEAFIKLVGEDVTVNGVTKRFFRDEIVPFSSGVLTASGAPKTIVTVSTRIEPDVARVILSYSVNLEQYEEYLRRHGVQMRV